MFAAVVLLERAGAFARNSFENRELEMPTGTIKKLVSDRGFGFIAAEDGREYFFHRTGLDPSVNFDSLAGGERVNFEIEPSQKGPRANRIKLA
ncbi:MAG TPA: cold shock domain-containing protein [Candidatus Dormibacteraeota bacterium]|jgi:CspA family cold shock protein